MRSERKVLVNVWWCELHQEVHQGRLVSDFSMKHRLQLHPVVAEISEDRRRLAGGRPINEVAS